jgi:hypothetical protein
MPEVKAVLMAHVWPGQQSALVVHAPQLTQGFS